MLGNQTHKLIKPATGRPVSAALLVQESDEIGLAAISLVADRSLLRALREELDVRVRLDVVLTGDGSVWSGVGVHDCDNTVRLRFESFRDLLINGFEGLAVSAPRGGECCFD